jgi:3-hydroxyisobutyrate dehydrogenase/2-hydroxy-3-oxopropionate reductase
VPYDTPLVDDGEVSRVAVLGLGAMGSRIARRLLDEGREVVVWNRTPSKADPLVVGGAAPAATPAEAARPAGAVITVLADPDALRTVTEGPDGIVAGVAPGATVIEMSTVGPEAIGWLAGALPEGVGLLDAPVLGSLGEAESGTLHLFVGGPEELFERWNALLSSLGSPIHVGPLGAGASAKLVANATLVGTLTLLGEIVALADALGLSREIAFRVLAETPLAAQAERRRGQLERGEFPVRFALALARKDARLIVEAAESAGIEARVLAAAAAWFAEADEVGFGDRDYSEVLNLIVDQRRSGA